MGLLSGHVCEVTINTLKLKGFDVRFDVTKTLKPEPNDCSIQVWNLSEANRAALEELRPKKADARGIPVLLEAGYEEDGPCQIFLGDLRTVYSVNDGPDWITTLESGDGEKAYQTSRIGVSFGAKTSLDTALRATIKALGVKQGNAAKVLQQIKLNGVGKILSQGITLDGPAAKVLTNITRSADLEWSIQDGALQILDRGKALAQTAIKVSPGTGLIGSPTVDNKGVLSCQTLMLPDLRPGRLIQVNSSRVSGNYRVEKVQWVGDTSGGEWYCNIEAKRYG
jgi:hypothetical protein